MVLRFFALKNNLDNYKKDLDLFLTDYMEKVTSGEIPFDYEKEKKIFEKTFQLIYDINGKNTFSRLIDAEADKYKSGIIMYLYDSFTCGVASCQSC